MVSDAVLLRRARAEIHRLKRQLHSVSGQGSLYHLDGVDNVTGLDPNHPGTARGSSRAAVRALRKQQKDTVSYKDSSLDCWLSQQYVRRDIRHRPFAI